jgi:hypothetical protein
MTTPSTTGQSDTSLTRDLIYAARYYLGRPRVLIALATVAIVAGLALNWSWLVAAGLAPILISTLPCLIMCTFGVCMMCRSAKEQSTPARDITEPLTSGTMLAPESVQSATPPAALATETDNPSASIASCCDAPAGDANPSQTIDPQPEERKPSHA